MKQTLQSFKQAFLQRPKYQRVAVYLLVSYALYCLILGILTPALLKQQLPKQLSEITGRDVSIAEIKINPFTLETTITDFAIAADTSTSGDFVHFKQFYANVSFWQSITEFAVVFDKISLDAPQAKIAQLSEELTSPQFNFDDIITQASAYFAPEQEQQPTTTEEPAQTLFPLQIKQLNIAAAALSIKDKATGSEINYPNINLAIYDFDTRANLNSEQRDQSQIQANQFSFSLIDDASSQLSISGGVQLKPLKLHSRINLTQFDLSYYYQFIDQWLEADLRSAFIGLSGSVNFDQESDVLALSNGQLSLDDVRFHAPNSEQAFIELGSFALADISFDSLAQQLTITKLTSDNLKVDANISADGSDLQRLLTPELPAYLIQTSPAQAEAKDQNEPVAQVNNQDDTAEAAHQAVSSVNINTAHTATLKETESPSEPLVVINGIEITNYQLNIIESIANQTANQWQIGELALTTGEVRSDLAGELEYKLQFTIQQDGQLSLEGKLDIQQQAAQIAYQMQDFPLSALQPYVSPYINVSINNGYIGTAGNVSIEPQTQDGNITVQGSVNAYQLDIEDNLLQTPLIAWQDMKLNQFDFNLKQNKLAIDQIDFHQMFSRIVIDEDGTNNIGHLVIEQTNNSGEDDETTNTGKDTQTNIEAQNLAQKQSQSQNNEPSDANSLAIDVNAINIHDSSAFFADNSLTPQFASGIEMLNGSIKKLSTTPETRASVDLQGKIDRYAPMSLKGEVNPLLAEPYVDLNLQFNKVELTSVNPYSGTYAGYYIDRGQLSINLNYQLQDNALKGSNHVVIDQLELGKPSNSSLATSLPISLAIALLQDRNGVIDLGVDVEGDLDSPSFSFGGIILKAMTNVITKAVTAPFSLLAGLVAEDDDMENVQFEFGSANITEDDKSKLDSLAKALVDRPLLKLNLKGAVEAVSDSQSLKEDAFKQTLSKRAALNYADIMNLSASGLPESRTVIDSLIALYDEQFGIEQRQTALAAIEKDLPGLSPQAQQTRLHISLYNQLVNAIELDENDLGELAHSRATAVKTYLVEQGKIDPSRIFLLESRVNYAQDEAKVVIGLDAD
ncbi:DUF748 domain-containing protein [Shewanella sp. WXL01]|uniref:DUF748 domain-containing protein n=1 Tax=Shewanella sp. WXL01 TaxID=2709721 RepID=UPI00143831BE|nr:DUF748 domain-containing protein [Shewanella sp. WXL01]NKF52474.1 DUF748 domain-containing protein [Shewanella sp. WXL01]